MHINSNRLTITTKIEWTQQYITIWHAGQPGDKCGQTNYWDRKEVDTEQNTVIEGTAGYLTCRNEWKNLALNLSGEQSPPSTLPYESATDEALKCVHCPHISTYSLCENNFSNHKVHKLWMVNIKPKPQQHQLFSDNLTITMLCALFITQVGSVTHMHELCTVFMHFIDTLVIHV